ncbi:LysR family transcriptional regulator [Nocardioides sp. CFH 31398]|uniref:LysR family transcriptional regulator n=1 Tax=Nocardioides sp. CFH 31398 TaxID=2919579 RepID=UPI001F06F813|nr:LysR family transcriptional regulator [Nocardioides sp. CFH 31398]MCH1867280.1 LysR family transcriptional regulator [Nocardioides sp. CFH 31398]
MDLRQLRYLTAVVHERSVTRAAARLHMTQPPLSAAIAQLEAELGVPLLERHGRGVEPTAAGEHLVARAAVLLRDLDDAAASVRALGSGLQGRLGVGVGPGVAADLLPALLSSYDRAAPEVDVDLLDLAEPDALDRVRTGACDVAVLFCARAAELERLHARELEVAMIRREPLVAVVPASSALAEPASLPGLRDSGLPWLAPLHHDGFPGLATRLGDAWDAVGGAPPTRRHLSSTETAVRLVASGAGLAIVPSSVAAVPTPGVRAVSLATPVAPVEAVAVWRRGERPSPVLTRFLRSALATPEPDRLTPEHARPPG